MAEKEINIKKEKMLEIAKEKYKNEKNVKELFNVGGSLTTVHKLEI